MSYDCEDDAYLYMIIRPPNSLILKGSQRHPDLPLPDDIWCFVLRNIPF